MKLAIESVRTRTMSLRKGGQNFDLPKDALHRRLQNKLKSLNKDIIHMKSLGSFKTILNEVQDEELVQLYQANGFSLFWFSYQ